jgi:hypothetical protein
MPNYRPRTTLLQLSGLIGEHFVGTPAPRTSLPALPSEGRALRVLEGLTGQDVRQFSRTSIVSATTVAR